MKTSTLYKAFIFALLPLLGGCLGSTNNHIYQTAPTQEAAKPSEEKVQNNGEEKKDNATEPMGAASKQSSDKPVKEQGKSTSVHDAGVGTTPTSPTTGNPLAKADIFPELVMEVVDSKQANDIQLDGNMTMHFNIEGQTNTIIVERPKGLFEQEKYSPNLSLVLPAGEATGMIKTFTVTADGTEQPEVEENFMSYQTFYSTVMGTRKTKVYFEDGGEYELENELFGIMQPRGLATLPEELPVMGNAIYRGRALDGERFGNFTYAVDFAAKEGKGGSIIWDKAGALGNVSLSGGKIEDTVLSIYTEADLLPDTHSLRGVGISGTAQVEGGEAHQFTSIFMGTKAEEMAGIVYHSEIYDMGGHHGHGHDDGISGEESRHNVATFVGER